MSFNIKPTTKHRDCIVKYFNGSISGDDIGLYYVVDGDVPEYFVVLNKPVQMPRTDIEDSDSGYQTFIFRKLEDEYLTYMVRTEALNEDALSNTLYNYIREYKLYNGFISGSSIPVNYEVAISKIYEETKKVFGHE